MVEEFEDKDEEVKPKQSKVGYNQIVDSVFAPSDYLNRCEMSIMPMGNKSFQMALVITRQRVQAALIKGEDYDIGELLLDSYAIVKRAEKGWLGEKAVELKALENDRDSSVIHQMSGE